jgi:hypothetical protein
MQRYANIFVRGDILSAGLPANNVPHTAVYLDDAAGADDWNPS